MTRGAGTPESSQFDDPPALRGILPLGVGGALFTGAALHPPIRDARRDE